MKKTLNNSKTCEEIGDVTRAVTHDDSDSLYIAIAMMSRDGHYFHDVINIARSDTM